MVVNVIQINIICNFVSILVIIFFTFFSINDIYLISFFLIVIYSGALVVTFMFVIMILDVNIFNNNIVLYWFTFVINQQI